MKQDIEIDWTWIGMDRRPKAKKSDGHSHSGHGTQMCVQVLAFCLMHSRESKFYNTSTCQCLIMLHHTQCRGRKAKL